MLQPGAQPHLYPQCPPVAWCCPCCAAPSPPAAQVRGGGDVLRLHPPFLPHSPPPQGVSPSPLEPHPGSKVSVSCEAESAHPDLTLLYWLGNGSFVEQLQPNVREGAVREEERGSLVTLRRDLHFNSFSFQDLRTNFTCVLLSPFGVDVRELKWATPSNEGGETG
uniref:Ig-like domain-containing protein n=1 Tax=Phasianus colchicus TaxID=9054 RepID=A0A669Q5B5_PHACC